MLLFQLMAILSTIVKAIQSNNPAALFTVLNNKKFINVNNIVHNNLSSSHCLWHCMNFVECNSACYFRKQQTCYINLKVVSTDISSDTDWVLYQKEIYQPQNLPSNPATTAATSPTTTTITTTPPPTTTTTTATSTATTPTTKTPPPTTTTTTTQPLPPPSLPPPPPPTTQSGLCSKMFIADGNQWAQGYKGIFIFIPVESVTSWEIIVEFDMNVNSLNVYNGITSNDGCRYITKNKGFNKNKAAGSSFEEGFQFLHSSQTPSPRISYVRFVGSTGPHLVCGTTSCS